MPYTPTTPQGAPLLVLLNSAQLRLISRACSHYAYDMCGVAAPETIEEMKVLGACATNALNETGAAGTVHVFAL